MSEDNIPVLDVDYHLREYPEDVLEYLKDCYSYNRDPAIEKAIKEIERLRNKCDMQAMILQRLTPETHPGVYFIHTEIGNKDANGMPEKLLVVPAYGVDYSYVYKRTAMTTGPEW